MHYLVSSRSALTIKWKNLFTTKTDTFFFVFAKAIYIFFLSFTQLGIFETTAWTANTEPCFDLPVSHLHGRKNTYSGDSFENLMGAEF